MYTQGIVACILIILFVTASGCSTLSTATAPAVKQDVPAEQSIEEIPTLPEKYVALPAITPQSGLSGSNRITNSALPARPSLVQSAQRTVLTGSSLSGDAVSSSITNANGSIPVAQFTSNIMVGYEPLTVQFTDTSLNKPTKWSWNFGDGSMSSLQNPVHTYTSVSQQFVGINAGNATGSDFANNSGSGVSATGSGSGGKYSVYLLVSNAYGRDDEIKTDYVTVYPPDITRPPTPLPTTQVPTPNPTVLPTVSPTPTPGLTVLPTVLPTLTPPPIPTPTEIPTVLPTPTPEPTVLPTVLPTLTPTPIPTQTISPTPTSAPTPIPTQSPGQPVKLIFIHHSSGGNWLADSNGGLGIALRDQNYFVSDTNYGWGSVGDYTDIGNWWTWFRGPDSPSIMSDVYAESEQNSDYSRLSNDPGGRNEIVMFKSCYPNSALQGNVNDPIPPIENNPLKGQSSDSPYHTISNAKGIYIDLLNYFQQHQDTLFIVVAAPPLSSPEYADNARAFNLWLVNDWLKNYPYKNVAVFDFYNVLTTNGGSPSVNDAGQQTGNHHRMWNNAVQHLYDGQHDTLAYYSGDDHPSKAGNKKATSEFVPYLNFVYIQWKGNATPIITPQPTTQPTTLPTTLPTTQPTVQPTINPNEECFGAETCNPTGNPIGGGEGYSDTIEPASETDTILKTILSLILPNAEGDVTYTVSTKAELIDALKNAKAGEIVFIQGSSAIDLTGTASVTIPAGVTLASDRGLDGSSGAVIKRTKNLNGGWEEPMFIAGGDNVRVTGLQIEGEMKPQDDSSVTERYYLVGLFANGVDNFLVDNCELRGWSWAAVSLRESTNSHIHHNYIHGNQAKGEGYGTCLYGGDAIVEANLYNYNRHDITGAGWTGEKYTFRYNVNLGYGTAGGGSRIDVHSDENGGHFAGDNYSIHHNTFRDNGAGVLRMLPIEISEKPDTGAYIYYNNFEGGTIAGGYYTVPIRQRAFSTFGRMFVTNNLWGNHVVRDGSIVMYELR